VNDARRPRPEWGGIEIDTPDAAGVPRWRDPDGLSTHDVHHAGVRVRSVDGADGATNDLNPLDLGDAEWHEVPVDRTVERAGDGRPVDEDDELIVGEPAGSADRYDVVPARRSRDLEARDSSQEVGDRRRARESNLLGTDRRQRGGRSQYVLFFGARSFGRAELLAEIQTQEPF